MDMTLGDTALILKTCRKHRMPKAQTAYILATAYWETNKTMKPVREAYWLSEQWRKDNLRYWPWYGRGYVQLTWEENYIKAQRILGTDLTKRPDNAMKPKIAAEVLVLGMRDGWFTGKRLSQYINDEEVDFIGARRIVNGTDRAGEIASLARAYRKELDSVPAEPAAGGDLGTIIAGIISAILAAIAGVAAWLN